MSTQQPPEVNAQVLLLTVHGALCLQCDPAALRLGWVSPRKTREKFRACMRAVVGVGMKLEKKANVKRLVCFSFAPSSLYSLLKVSSYIVMKYHASKTCHKTQEFDFVMFSRKMACVS
jgi:hypothetical protein